MLMNGLADAVIIGVVGLAIVYLAGRSGQLRSRSVRLLWFAALSWVVLLIMIDAVITSGDVDLETAAEFGDISLALHHYLLAALAAGLALIAVILALIQRSGRESNPQTFPETQS